ncbi:hypothetical protein Zmor_003901 [Zophobas morio]|uniref:Uncharacterized protein n=1 Tax=Zophobas morio TaxID=2755281 RepID=A0AA38HIC4_9CUCU|nr:hypothetical protein Zmor_003901 [Zophobas morio]
MNTYSQSPTRIASITPILCTLCAQTCHSLDDTQLRNVLYADKMAIYYIKAACLIAPKSANLPSDACQLVSTLKKYYNCGKEQSLFIGRRALAPLLPLTFDNKVIS